MSQQPTPIGIAVVEHDGCYLVGIRGDDVSLPGYAEFPGGKCHLGETPKECVQRECTEETGLAVIPVELLLNRTFPYEHDTVDLHFWLCQPADSNSIEDSHRSFRWFSANELVALRFPEANQPVIELLLERFTF